MSDGSNLPATIPADVPVADALSNLPVKQGDDFIGEFETMNLDELRDKTFLVSVSREDRSKGKFICTTIHGPYDFYEMCEEVGTMWKEHQHHAKVYLAQKDRYKAARYLDENTVDYIEAHYDDIIMEGLLEGVFDENKEYTCRAGINEDTSNENPLLQPKEVEPTEEEDD